MKQPGLSGSLFHPMDFMIKYLIICPLVFIAGFIDAIAGGGGLISLPAFMITGLPIHNCIATNKMSSFMGTSIATAKYARSGLIPWKQALCCIPCALAGSAVGANLALLVDDGPFRIIMLVIVPLTGAYVLTRKEIAPPDHDVRPSVSLIISVIISFFIGIYDGFYGPGTGTFLILLLTGLAGLQLGQANGLTKAVNLSTNVSALVVYLVNGQVLFPLGIIAGCFNILGNYLGARQFEKGGSKMVKPVIIVVLTVFFIKILTGLLQ